jgi:hypothetical protein
MRETEPAGRAVIRGVIRNRLLVNAVVDPDEAAARLPDGLRPHLVEGGTVVGCCLLDLDHVRPPWLPAVAGRRLRAAAHRISVEWEDGDGETIVGVYVPVRHTDSRLAVALGGRLVPAVHEPARVELAAPGDGLTWSVDPVDATAGLAVRVVVSIPERSQGSSVCDPIGGTCLRAAVGLSPDHRGDLEGTRMDLAHRDASEVVVEQLASTYLGGFSTAQPAPSYLLRDVDVTWRPAPAPRLLAGTRR